MDGRSDLWEVTVEPQGLSDVTVTLTGGLACGTTGAVCTGDGEALSNTVTATVKGPHPAQHGRVAPVISQKRAHHLRCVYPVRLARLCSKARQRGD